MIACHAPAVSDPAESASRALRVKLPGGYVDDMGRVHRDADVRPLDGRDEEALARLGADAPAAAVATALLARCLLRVGAVHDVTPELARALLAGDRDYLVLRIREATLGRRMLLTLSCPLDGCGAPMHLALDVATIPVDERPVDARTLRSAAGIPFALPTGADQEAVAASGGVEDDTALALLSRCLERAGAGPAAALDDATRAALEREMGEAAPGPTLDLTARCPECGRDFEAPLDLVPLALAELKGSPTRLEQEIHLLAWNYHWSEREILALPYGKRRRYVALVREQLGAHVS